MEAKLLLELPIDGCWLIVCFPFEAKFGDKEGELKLSKSMKESMSL